MMALALADKGTGRALLLHLSLEEWGKLREQAAQRKLEDNALISMLLQAYLNPPPEPEPPPQPMLPEHGQPEHLVLLAQNYAQLAAMRTAVLAELCRYGVNPSAAHFDGFIDLLIGESGLDFARNVLGIEAPEEVPPVVEETPKVATQQNLPLPLPHARVPLSNISPDLDMARFEALLARIPEKESQALRAYHLDGVTQKTIAEQEGVTQAAISYRLDRGRERIRFMLQIPNFTEDDLRNDLSSVNNFAPFDVFSQSDIDILVYMWRTTCQSETARLLGCSQGKIKHRFDKLVRKLSNLGSSSAKGAAEFQVYATTFSAISANLNMLHEVKLPQWENRKETEEVNG